MKNFEIKVKKSELDDISKKISESAERFFEENKLEGAFAFLKYNNDEKESCYCCPHVPLDINDIVPLVIATLTVSTLAIRSSKPDEAISIMAKVKDEFSNFLDGFTQHLKDKVCSDETPQEEREAMVKELLKQLKAVAEKKKNKE